MGVRCLFALVIFTAAAAQTVEEPRGAEPTTPGLEEPTSIIPVVMQDELYTLGGESSLNADSVSNDGFDYENEEALGKCRNPSACDGDFLGLQSDCCPGYKCFPGSAPLEGIPKCYRSS